jgi:hypothetical protein
LAQFRIWHGILIPVPSETKENEGFMKRIFLTIWSVVMIIMLVGANVRETEQAKPRIKKSSGCGYRIVEFGIGVDCNGDTVRLTKSKGFQSLAKQIR